MEAIGKSTQSVTDTVTGAQAAVNKTNVNYTMRNAGGTDYFPGGRTWVGEEGPELVTLPAGSQITPANKVAAGTTIYNNYITIDAKNVQDFNRVVGSTAENGTEEDMRWHQQRLIFQRIHGMRRTTR